MRGANMNEIMKKFENRNIEFKYFTNRTDLITTVKGEVDKCNSIGIGNSKTLKELQISVMMKSLGKVVYDKTLVNGREEINKLKKLSLMSECYISSCNALTRDGKIVNVDHSGNRVAAITYGPDKVIIIVGENKLVDNEDEAVKRAMKIATPLNAKRAKIDSPCSNNKPCSDCSQEVRVCNYLSIIRGQNVKGRMKVFMINEDIGF